MGLGPASMRNGDCIAFALGCREPLVLRPHPQNQDSDDTYFRLVGTCYIHGYMNSEALLGAISEGWTHTWTIVSGGPINTSAVNTYTKTDGQHAHVQQLDPRLGDELPKGWQCWYKPEDESSRSKDEFNSDGEMRNLWFEDVESGEITRCDPRLRSEHLKTRGVKIQDLFII